jgi:hypothetical protein
LLSGLWVFLEALLFGLIGTQIVITHLNLHLIGYGTLVMILALAVSLSQITPLLKFLKVQTFHQLHFNFTGQICCFFYFGDESWF